MGNGASNAEPDQRQSNYNQNQHRRQDSFEQQLQQIAALQQMEMQRQQLGEQQSQENQDFYESYESSYSSASMQNPTTVPPLNVSKKKLELTFHLHRDSFKLRRSASSNTRFYISFIYSSVADIIVTIYYAGQDVMDSDWNTMYFHYDDKYPTPVRFKLPQGLKRNFPPKKAGFDMQRIGADILDRKHPNIYPIIIDMTLADCPEGLGVNSQATLITFDKQGEGKYKPKVYMQKVKIGGKDYELCDIYGMENKDKSQMNEDDDK